MQDAYQATSSRNFSSETRTPLRSTLSAGKGRLFGSNEKYPNTGDSMRATGTSSTSKNLVPGGKSKGVFRMDYIIDQNKPMPKIVANSPSMTIPTCGKKNTSRKTARQNTKTLIPSTRLRLNAAMTAIAPKIKMAPSGFSMSRAIASGDSPLGAFAWES